MDDLQNRINRYNEAQTTGERAADIFYWHDVEMQLQADARKMRFFVCCSYCNSGIGDIHSYNCDVRFGNPRKVKLEQLK